MFTIKHEDNNGFSLLLQAKQLISERRSDGYTQFIAFNENRHDYVATWCADERTGPCSDALYVMNEVGATVAIYRFNKPNFASGGEVVAA